MTAPGPRSIEPMTPSLSADNMPAATSGRDLSLSGTPPLKRKIDEDGVGNATRPSGEGKENDRGGEKRAKIDLTDIPSSPAPFSPHVTPRAIPNATAGSSSAGVAKVIELQKGKLVLKQAPHTFEIPRRKKLAFEAYLLDVQEGNEKIHNGLPEEHYTVIVMAGQEATVYGDGHLINHIKKVLDMKDLSDVIPADIWQSLVDGLFRQKQYGVTLPDIAAACPSVKKVPAALQVRSWEARKSSAHFSEEQLVLVRARMAERARGREDVVRMLAGMSDAEVAELVRGDKAEKGEKKEKLFKDSPAPSVERKSREGTAASGVSGRSASPVKKSKMSTEEEEAARVKQEEREAKKAAKEEKRIQKEEKEAAKQAEMQKKEASLAKQKQNLKSFFNLKPAAKAVPASKPSEAGPSKPAKVPQSDYLRVFKPLQIRPNVEWAPLNRFRYQRRSATPEETKKESVDWPLSDHVKHLVKKSGVKSCANARLPEGLKTAPLYGSVGDVWLEHQDALDPRKVLNRLKDQRKFPWKTLAFDSQVRPPYSGTFTKKSIVVGPRTPFAQDPMFDYSYDSGDDWQDDEGGEDVDDNANLEPEEQEEDDGEDEGEFDDWLDDSEDVVVVETADGVTPMEIDADAPVFVSGGQPTQVKVIKKKEAPPKRVVKVIPTWRGPLWEREIGEGNEGMEMYRIQLLNDTPDSIDPFTYISSEPTPKFNPTFSTIAVGHHISVKTLLAVDTTYDNSPFDAKPLPVPVGLPTPRTSLEAPSAIPLPVQVPSATKPKPTGPKVAFPSTHLAELLRLIEGNNCPRAPDLVNQLKAHFDKVASKTAIEFKLKEVAVKEGGTKNTVWRVLPEAWKSAGLQAPSRESAGGMIIAA